MVVRIYLLLLLFLFIVFIYFLQYVGEQNGFLIASFFLFAILVSRCICLLIYWMTDILLFHCNGADFPLILLYQDPGFWAES